MFSKQHSEDKNCSLLPSQFTNAAPACSMVERNRTFTPCLFTGSTEWSLLSITPSACGSFTDADIIVLRSLGVLLQPLVWLQFDIQNCNSTQAYYDHPYKGSV